MIDIYHYKRSLNELHHILYLFNYPNYPDNFQFHKPIILFRLIEHFVNKYNRLHIYAQERSVRIIDYIINYDRESPFFKSVQIDIKTTIKIEMYQKNKVGKCFLKILKSSDFCFNRFVKRNIKLTLSKMTL